MRIGLSPCEIECSYFMYLSGLLYTAVGYGFGRPFTSKESKRKLATPLIPHLIKLLLSVGSQSRLIIETQNK